MSQSEKFTYFSYHLRPYDGFDGGRHAKKWEKKIEAAKKKAAAAVRVPLDRRHLLLVRGDDD
jgi:hypothetical protein